MGRYEVTQGEYQAVMGSNPSYFTGDVNRPVEQVNWSEATNYCGKLTTQERLAGRLPADYLYRLPTEAEWDYACRAGTTTRFSYGDDPGYSQLGQYAWYWDNSNSTTHRVGTKNANRWGLYDMHGNVYEWCADWYGAYPGGSVTDPAGPGLGSRRVLRGGGWYYGGGKCRSASRGYTREDDWANRFGFRVVLAWAPPEAPQVTARPQSQTVGVGSTATFTVTISGSEPLAYQWRKGGVNLVDGGRISGVATATLTIANCQTSDVGNYDVVVSNAAGSVTTETVTLTVRSVEVVVNGQPVTGDQVRVPAPAAVELRSPQTDWYIFYALDGSVPDETDTLYAEPLTLETATVVYAVAFSPDFTQSLLGSPVSITFFRSQTITITPVTGVKFGDGPLTLQAAASSGLLVAWALISGPGELQGNVLTIKGAGLVVVRATQAGNGEYSPAQADLAIQVARAEQTITWAALSNRTFGDPPFTMAATASSGLAVAFEVASGAAQVQGNQVTLTGAGAVGLRARQEGDTNYLPAALERGFQVAKAPQSITFGALLDRAFSPESFDVQAQASSGLAVQFSILSGPAAINGNRVTLTGVGRVIVRAQQPGNENYLAAGVVDRSFNVTQATQTVTFEQVPAKVFGDPPVVVKATSSAGLTPVQYTVLSGPGLLEGDRLTLLGAGMIVVQARQAGDQRYAAAQAQVQVSVSKASQSIIFPPLADRGYSTNRIALGATASSALPVGYVVLNGAAAIVETNWLMLTTNVGLVEVRADQPGNTNYLAALSVTNCLTVSRGEQSIDFAPIGDQVLGLPPIALSATASSGLAVAFEVLSGSATLSAGKLTLLDEGLVTVRAKQVGSRLYLPTSAEQSFQVRRMAMLTVMAGPGGRVAKNPDKELFTPGESAVVTATADVGYEFSGWSGDATGAQNPLTVILDRNKRLNASFRDSATPVVQLSSPVTGATARVRGR